MRVVHVTLIVLLASIALAGCSGKDGSDPTTSAPRGSVGTGTSAAASSKAPGSTSGTPASTSAPASSASAKKNTPPTASTIADVMQGALPLNVTFTLKGTDADSDPLTWTFDANGDAKNEKEGKGTELPATVKYSYATAGNYTVTFKVSDGKNTTTAKSVIQVLAAGAEAATKDYTCSASPGGVVGTGGGGPAGLTVVTSGCTLLSVTAAMGTLVVKDVKFDEFCDASADVDGDGLSDEDVAKGTKMKAGWVVSLACTVPDSSGTLTVAKA